MVGKEKGNKMSKRKKCKVVEVKRLTRERQRERAGKETENNERKRGQQRKIMESDKMGMKILD